MEVIKRWCTALLKHSEGLGWSVASGIIGAGIGLMAATLWGRTVGW